MICANFTGDYGDKPYGANQFYGNFNSWERTKSWFAGFKQELGKDTEFDLGYRRHSDVFVLSRDHPEIYENNHITESWQTALRRKTPIRQNITLFYGGKGTMTPSIVIILALLREAVESLTPMWTFGR
jgi:hypothetical protein